MKGGADRGSRVRLAIVAMSLFAWSLPVFAAPPKEAPREVAPAPRAAASQPSTKAAGGIDAQTRPELFRDTPPVRAREADDGSRGLQPDAPRGPEPESASSFWFSMLLRTTLVLAAVVLLAYLLLNKGLGRLLQATGAGGGKRLMRVVERLMLDSKHSLILVEVDGRRWVLATGEGGARLVAELGAAAPALPGDVAGGNPGGGDEPR